MGHHFLNSLPFALPVLGQHSRHVFPAEPPALGQRCGSLRALTFSFRAPFPLAVKKI